MATWFSSDLHFGHDREFIWGPRGFKNVQSHDQAIIENWNEVVSPQDDCYILGDIMLGADHEYGLNCLKSLNGRKYLIRGNHDTDRRWAEYETLDDVECLGWSDVREINGYNFYLCHYPTETSTLKNNAPLRHHLICLSGHTHSKDKFYQDKPYIYNVALDAQRCCPVSIEQIIEDIKTKVDECLNYL